MQRCQVSAINNIKMLQLEIKNLNNNSENIEYLKLITINILNLEMVLIKTHLVNNRSNGF